MRTPAERAGPVRRPWTVTAAAGVVAAEAAALVAFSGWLLLRRIQDVPSNERVFEGAAVYLLLSGVLVALIAMALRSLRGWAYGAAVLVQLLAFGVTYNMAQAGFWAGAVPLALGAAGVLAALLARPSRHAFGRDTS